MYINVYTYSRLKKLFISKYQCTLLFNSCKSTSIVFLNLTLRVDAYIDFDL